MIQKTLDRAFRMVRALVGSEHPRLDDGRYWIWHGFSATAISDLNTFLEAPERGRSLKASAAFELARWFCGAQDYETALRYLQFCERAPPARRSVRIKLSKIQADILSVIGSELEKQKFIEDHLLESDIEFHLSLANVARTTTKTYPELDPINTLNRAYISNRLSPIRKIREDQPHSIDNLTARSPARSSIPADHLVSVIMPTWQAASTVETAMRSLAEQSYPNLEVIVVDDASEDGTADIVESFAREDRRFRLVRSQTNIGSYACRNLALRSVRGAFITVQDADDWSHPNKIETQISHLRRTDTPYNLAMWVRGDNELRFRGNDIRSSRLIGPDHSSAMFRYPVLEKSGGWDNVRISADTELMWRIETSLGKPRRAFKSRRIVEGCPLSIGRIEERSLTRQSQTHISTIRFGVRQEYREAAQHWHNSLPARWESRSLERHETLFPVPSFIRSVRFDEQPPASILIANFYSEDPGDRNFRLLRAIVEAKHGSCAIFHHPDYEQRKSISISHLVRSFAWENDVRIVVAGEQLSVGLSLLPDLRLLRHALDNPPKVETRNAKLIVGKGHSSDRKIEGETTGALLKKNGISVTGETETFASTDDLILHVRRLSDGVASPAKPGG